MIEPLRLLPAVGIVLILFGLCSWAAQPVITGVSIPDLSMKINDIVTVTISVQSDSATVYTLDASSIGGYVLGSLSKQDSASYTAMLTVTEGGTDYAAGDDIPTSVTLADSGLTDTWNTPISQAADPIDANRPVDPTPSSTSHTVNVWDNDDTIDIAITGASDAGGTGIDGFDTAWDQNGAWAATEVKDQEETWTGSAFTATADGDWYFHISTVDNAGNWTSTEHLGPFRIDVTPPSIPANLSPADGAYTNDISPALSWGASTDSGGSGIRDTETYRYVVDGTPSRSGYTANTTYTPTLDEGVYVWRVRARDNAGNNSDYIVDRTLIIDVTNPLDPAPSSTSHTMHIPSNDVTVDIAISGASDPLSNGASSGVDGFATAWDRNATWVAAEVKDQEETWSGGTFTATSDGDWYFHIATVDNAGNWTGTEHLGPFQIDTGSPAVTSVLVDTDPMFEGDLTQQVTVTFDEAMDTGTDPTITFGAGTFISNSDAAWSVGDTVWTETFTLTDNDEEIAVVTVDVTEAKDVAGNDQEAYAEQHEFTIDTCSPTVIGILAWYDLITDSLIGEGSQQSFLVSFSEEMNQAFDPILSLSPDVTSPPTTLTHVSAMDEWSFDGTEFEASYDIYDAEYDADDVSVGVTAAKDLAGNPMQSYTPEHEFEVDTLDPTVISVTLSADSITDADVGGTFSVTIDYSEDMLESTEPTIAFSPNLNSTLSYRVGNSDWADSDTYVASYTALDGNVTVLDDDITISATQDLVGNVQESYNHDGQLDVDTENPYFHDFSVAGGAVDDNCLRVVTFTAKVTDPNGTMVPGGITVVDATATNATIAAVYDISQVSDSQTTITITGKVGVTALTGCSAVVTITLDAVDSVDNDAARQSQFSDVVDTTSPVINALVVDDHVLMSAGCCDATVNFTANVTDNCCIAPGGITITPTNPTNNLTIDFDQACDVTITQNSQGRVDINGVVPVRCLTSCPAIVQVRVNATDCCGNNAVTVTSIATEGRVYDEAAPESGDDPNGDEDRSTSDNLEVRSDDRGQHRLMVREDTPVQIHVNYNDDDNCSSCACCGTMWIHDIVDSPEYGTAIADVDHSDTTGGGHIRYAPYRGYSGPDEFTYRIVDACGNVSQEATVFIEVVAQTEMDDVYLTTCIDKAVSFDVKAADLWIDPDNPGEIPFTFSIVTPPMHGVISGDLGDVAYVAPGATTKEIESAAIMLIYTPAAGFVGRDEMVLRVADPFGGSSTALVDIEVITCAEQPGTQPPIVLQPGDSLPLIVPLTFASLYETAWGSVTLIAETDGAAYQSALFATREKSNNRYVLGLDTAALPPGLYRMTIPLGNGETVTLMIEVSEAI